MGAWIETIPESKDVNMLRSHPMWVRGLKQSPVTGLNGTDESHPMWVRGLKLERNNQYRLQEMVAPYVGAWIETLVLNPLHQRPWSHPMWVRGLKL